MIGAIIPSIYLFIHLFLLLFFLYTCVSFFYDQQDLFS